MLGKAKKLLVARGIKFLLGTPEHTGSQLQEGDIVTVPGTHTDG